MLQLLLHAVALQDVDNAEEEEQALALVIAGRNAAGPERRTNKSSITTTAAIRKWPLVQGKFPGSYVPQSSFIEKTVLSPSRFGAASLFSSLC